jgi:hypothetical protein
MKKMIALAIVCALLAGCYSSDDARKALEAEGFTDIQVNGHAWFACSEDDFYNTSFTAKNAHGNTVSGAVCSGILFKNSTIRW